MLFRLIYLVGSDECTCICVSFGFQKRSSAQVYKPIYHVQEPIVPYKDKVLLALPYPTEFVQNVSKEFF